MLERQAKEHYVSPFTFAVLYSRLGDTENALKHLKQARDEHYPFMVFVPIEPVCDNLRSQPRFQDLVQHIVPSALGCRKELPTARSSSRPYNSWQ